MISGVHQAIDNADIHLNLRVALHEDRHDRFQQERHRVPENIDPHALGRRIAPSLENAPRGRARLYREDLQRRAIASGRERGDVRLMAGVTVVTGETVAQAHAKRQALDEIAGIRQIRLETLAKTLNVPAGDLRLEEPLPASAFAQIDDKNRAAGFVQGLLGYFAGGNKTVSDFLREGSIGHRALIGDARTIADSFEEWLAGDAADGFVLMFDQNPSGLTDFVDLVVPELRRRGLFRREYRGGETLGQLLDLPRYRQA